MAQHLRRDSNGYARFALALTLSTVTAVAVAAPLAITAINADEPGVVTPVAPDGADQPPGGPEGVGATPDRSLTADSDGDAKGGIGSEPLAKAKAQTTKSATTSTTSNGTSTPDAPDETVPESSTTTDTSEDPGSTTSTSTPASTTTTAEGTSTTSSTSPSTTATTGPSTTASGSSTGQGGSE